MRRDRLDRSIAWGATLAVALLALAVAVALYLAYRADPASLWRDPYHDRNSHLLTGLDLALALAAGDPAGAFAAATRTLAWPPLHGLLLGLTFLAGGPRLELAILPSLLGWWATILATWLLAWRSARPGLPAWAGASVAASFALLSPAFRLLGSDVMLEGLGAGLSAWTLLAGQACLARPGAGRARRLGLLLTLLFLEKYNYWLIAVAALAATMALAPALRRPAMAAAALLLRAAAAALPRNPAMLLGLLVAAIAPLLPAAPAIRLAGRDLALDPLGQILPIGYGLLLVGLAWEWRARRAVLGPRLPPSLRMLLAWHVVPVALWLLQPWALAAFFRFVGQGAGGAGAAGYAPWRAAAFQWAGFSEGFSVAPWAGALALGLALLGGIRLARGDDARRLVAVTAAVAMAAVLLHPHQQWRFAATALFAVWSCAGAGAAALAGGLARRLPPLLAGGVAVGAVAALAAASLAQPAPRLAEAVAIRTPAAASDLALADLYGPLVAGAPVVGFVGPGRSDLYPWTVHLRCRCLAAVEQPDLERAGSADAVRGSVAAWLAASRADRIVAIDPPETPPLPGAATADQRRRGIADALAGQDRFRPAGGATAPDGTRLRLYRRRGDAPAVAAPRRLHLLDSLALGLGAAVLLLLLPARRGAAGATPPVAPGRP